MATSSQTKPWGMKPAVVVFAKAPKPGRVKTRLCPPLTPETAAALQAACLADLWSRLAALSGVERILCHDPPGSEDLFRALLGREISFLPQSPGDMGDRIAAAFDCLFASGMAPVVALGADSPDLPLSLITSALDLLASRAADVALAPAEDGGYVLIGLSRPHPAAFQAIPWSTSRVYAATLARCSEAGLRVCTLPLWYDVDDISSLTRLRARVLACPEEYPALCRFFAAHCLDPSGEERSPLLPSLHSERLLRAHDQQAV